jgi:glycine oxidase
VTDQHSSTDVVIVGGGAIGLAVGWRAARRGLSVVVLDRATPGEATSRVAAGMIAPIAEAAPSEPAVLALALESARRYPGFVEELVATGAPDPGYRSCGTLLVARDSDEAAALDRELAFRRSLELPVRRLRGSEARSLEPALAPTLRLGLEIPDDHAIDPRALVRALAHALEHAGGELRSGAEVTELICDGERVRGVRLADGLELEAEQVVVAAGPWSNAVPGLPPAARVPLRPVKGQILGLRDPSGPGLLERVIRMQPGYLVPRGDGRYVLGATVEERGFDTTVTAGAVFELLRDAIELVPGVSEFVVEELMAGIRPGTPDNAPAIGPGVLDGLFWATGHYRHGILLAPITGELVAGALAGEPLPPLAEPFAPCRFAPIAGAGVAVRCS